jgi:hypothetical protein
MSVNLNLAGVAVEVYYLKSHFKEAGNALVAHVVEETKEAKLACLLK